MSNTTQAERRTPIKGRLKSLRQATGSRLFRRPWAIGAMLVVVGIIQSATPSKGAAPTSNDTPSNTCTSESARKKDKFDPSQPWPQRQEATELAVGEIRTIASVCPETYYYPSLIKLTPSAVYRITASGQWRDASKVVGPEGWLGFLLEIGARLPFRPIFILTGSVGRSDRFIFGIKTGRNEWRAPSAQTMPLDRQLYFFPNDWRLPIFYQNNHAYETNPLTVQVERLF